MGRSAKECCRPPQAVDGGGRVRRSKTGMGAGKDIKPSDEGAGGVDAKAALEKKGKQPKQKEAKAEPAKSPEEMTGSGWDKIGEAGASMVTTYNKRKDDPNYGKT